MYVPSSCLWLSHSVVSLMQAFVNLWQIAADMLAFCSLLFHDHSLIDMVVSAAIRWCELSSHRWRTTENCRPGCCRILSTMLSRAVTEVVCQMKLAGILQCLLVKWSRVSFKCMSQVWKPVPAKMYKNCLHSFENKAKELWSCDFYGMLSWVVYC